MKFTSRSKFCFLALLVAISFTSSLKLNSQKEFAPTPPKCDDACLKDLDDKIKIAAKNLEDAIKAKDEAKRKIRQEEFDKMVKDAQATLANVITLGGELATKASKLLNDWKNSASAAIKDAFSKAGNAVKNVFKGISDTVSKVGTSIEKSANSAVDSVSKVFKSARESLSKKWTWLKEGVKQTVADVKAATSKVAAETTSYLKEQAAKGKEKLDQVCNNIKSEYERVKKEREAKQAAVKAAKDEEKKKLQEQADLLAAMEANLAIANEQAEKTKKAWLDCLNGKCKNEKDTDAKTKCCTAEVK